MYETWKTVEFIDLLLNKKPKDSLFKILIINNTLKQLYCLHDKNIYKLYGQYKINESFNKN